MREDVVSNAEKLTNLENALRDERCRHVVAEEQMQQEQQVIVGNLQRQLNEALARVDRLSADLAKERSLRDVPPVLLSPRR